LGGTGSHSSQWPHKSFCQQFENAASFVSRDLAVFPDSRGKRCNTASRRNRISRLFDTTNHFGGFFEDSDRAIFLAFFNPFFDAFRLDASTMVCRHSCGACVCTGPLSAPEFGGCSDLTCHDQLRTLGLYHFHSTVASLDIKSLYV